MTDLELAKAIAEGAGKILLDLRATGLFEGKALGKAGDRVANEFIMTALRENRPDDAILSEEEKDSAARLSAERVWIVDPLDGTREYGEGRTDWAVHIALSIGGKPAIGAVALPG
ncbi:MAG: 3'(2'),5'-bisphosphate nucleotidase CysQ, partial [Rhodospirillales bacterium]|nr:3'(2'),5'-bisphosphate nucleotidase CysQ [Rhodospirillales bacterium]